MAAPNPPDDRQQPSSPSGPSAPVFPTGDPLTRGLSLDTLSKEIEAAFDKEPGEEAAPEAEAAAPDPAPETPPEIEESEESEEPDADPDADEDPAKEADAEGSDEEVRTLSDLAKIFDLEEPDLASAIHVTAEDGTEHALSEVIAGWKSQPAAAEMASQRETFEQEMVTTRSDLQGQHDEALLQVANVMQVLHGQLQSGPSDVDLERIRLEDPEQYANMKIQRMETETALRNGIASMQEEGRRRVDEIDHNRAEWVKTEQAKQATAWPELFAQETGPKVEQRVRSYLGGIGFSKTEINDLVDHRFFRVIRDAVYGSAVRTKGKVRLDAAREKGLRLPRPTPKARAEEKGRDAQQAERVQERLSQFQKTGNVRDAATVLEEMGID